MVSIEMLEHVRNYQALFQRISAWLKPDGLFFVHIFSHRHLAYTFEVRDSSDWMAQHFFTGGQMPSDDLFRHFEDDLSHRGSLDAQRRPLQSKRLRRWLARMDQHRTEIMPLFAKTYGSAEALKWWVRWRMFFMASSELWNLSDGEAADRFTLLIHAEVPACTRSPGSDRTERETFDHPYKNIKHQAVTFCA